MYEASGVAAYLGVARGLLVITSAVIAFLAVRTAIAVSRNEICVRE